MQRDLLTDMQDSGEATKSKIVLCTIVKDDSEGDEMERMLESFTPYVYTFVVAITGVSGKFDKLKELILKYKGSYVITTPATHPDIYAQDENGVFFANFAQARNESFKLADTIKGADWYIWADKDDILVSGEELQAVADKALQDNLDQVMFPYWYSIRLKEDNTFDENDVQIEHLRERLMKPRMFKWISRLHEVSVPVDGNYKPRISIYNYSPKENQLCVWAHITSRDLADQNMDRNLRILELQVKEESYKDPRTLFYLARVYFDRDKEGDRDKALLIITRDYLKMSGWPEERGNAWQLVGDIYASRGEHRQAIDAYHNAVKEWPSSHMPYLSLSREYAQIGLHDQATFWVDCALRMDPPHARTTIGNPMQIKYMAANLKYNDAIRRTNVKEAIYWLDIRNKFLGIKEDPMLDTLLESQETEEAAKHVFEYAKWLKRTKQLKYIAPLLESLPYELGSEPFAHYIANDIKEPKTWPKKSIVYYANFGGQFFEKFSGITVNTGVGGSETAVYELSKRWVKMGYEVTIYSDPREDAGMIEGVNWRPWYECNFNDHFNIFIVWRATNIVDKIKNANKIFFDAHDIVSQIEWTQSRMDKITKVFFKSNFHRSMLPKLQDEKAAIISNGITI